MMMNNKGRKISPEDGLTIIMEDTTMALVNPKLASPHYNPAARNAKSRQSIMNQMKADVDVQPLGSEVFSSRTSEDVMNKIDINASDF